MTAHLPVLPVVVPLSFAALLLLTEHRGIVAQRLLGGLGLLASLASAIALLVRADRGVIDVYLVGDWPARLGIALVVDRLSAMLVLSTALLGVASLLHAGSGWDRRSPHFHALFQFQLAGLAGAFLTGDLFNLFVCFEVMLIASYGLLLGGGRGPGMRAGLHYVVFNVAASTVFLIALGLLYGLLGTLNMAEMAVRVAAAEGGDVALIRAASALLLLVFCAKAALLPLYLWLPSVYARAPAAALVLFAIMTKLGVYAVLRVHTLLFGGRTGELAAGWAWEWLLPASAITLALATLGALAASTLRMLAAYLVIASASTLFVAFALATPETVAAGLYYLLHSTFVTAALFLVADLIRQQRGAAGDVLDIAGPLRQRALLGSLFATAALSVVGLPPLSGFIGKVALLDAVPAGSRAWVWPLLLITSWLSLVALARTASQVFWRAQAWPEEAPLPAAPQRAQVAATALLLAYGLTLVFAGGPVMRYTQATAAQVLAPADYVRAAHDATPQLRAPSP